MNAPMVGWLEWLERSEIAGRDGAAGTGGGLVAAGESGTGAGIIAGRSRGAVQ
jgi:hypothetical protein